MPCSRNHRFTPPRRSPTRSPAPSLNSESFITDWGNDKIAYRGAVLSLADALIIITAVLKGQTGQVVGKLVEVEKKRLVRSGVVLVFQEGSIRRWTDCITWSPSRIFRQFLLYRETEQEPSVEDLGEDVSDDTILELQGSVRDGQGHPNRPGYVRPGGLIKRTITLTYGRTSYRIVSYYHLQDVLNEKLCRPSEDPRFSHLLDEVPEELLEPRLYPRCQLLTKFNDAGRKVFLGEAAIPVRGRMSKELYDMDDACSSDSSFKPVTIRRTRLEMIHYRPQSPARRRSLTPVVIHAVPEKFHQERERSSSWASPPRYPAALAVNPSPIFSIVDPSPSLAVDAPNFYTPAPLSDQISWTPTFPDATPVWTDENQPFNIHPRTVSDSPCGFTSEMAAYQGNSGLAPCNTYAASVEPSALLGLQQGFQSLYVQAVEPFAHQSYTAPLTYGSTSALPIPIYPLDGDAARYYMEATEFSSNALPFNSMAATYSL